MSDIPRDLLNPEARWCVERCSLILSHVQREDLFLIPLLEQVSRFGALSSCCAVLLFDTNHPVGYRIFVESDLTDFKRVGFAILN